MDPVFIQVLLAVGSMVGGYFLRHLTAPKTPAVPDAPVVPSSHPLLGALGPAVVAVLQAALEKRATAAGHGELTDLLTHVAPPVVPK